MTVHRGLSEFDVYDIACLAGGPERVVDAALVELAETGRIRVTAPGTVATVSLVRRHPVEGAVLDAVGPSGHRSVETVRWRLTTDDRIHDVERRLRSDGLVSSSARIPAARRGGWRAVPTYAGRRLLRQLLADPPADRVAGGTCAMAVALGGRAQLATGSPSTELFADPPHPLDGGFPHRPPHDLDHADGVPAARRTRARIAADATRLGGWIGS